LSRERGTTIIATDAASFELRRGFSVSALRRRDKPPRKDGEDKDAVKEEAGEEGKRKEKQGQTRAKSDDGKAKPGEESLKGGSSADGRGNGNGEGGGLGGGGGSGGRRRGPSDRALQKPSVPDIYPQVMALPIAKRPLFPGFYKAVTVRDPAVAAAIQEMMKRGQPYIGAFLFKDENADRDTIESTDEVHEVGVFAQITSAFPVHGEEGSLTAVLYPHRRIKISRLLPQENTDGKQEVPEPIEEIEDEAKTQESRGDVVASFEEDVEKKPAANTNPYATAFLKKYNVSIVDVENLMEQPVDKKSPVVRAVTSEIVNVFKEVANLNPLFRDQISTFSMSQSAGNVIDEPAKLADFAAAVSAGEVKELQEVLETLDVEERLKKALVVLKKELMNAQLQSKISKDVEAKIQKRQREYWLMEQMKGIRRELGIESDGKDKLVEKFKEKAEKLAMPEAVKKVFDEVCHAVYNRRKSML
jgi:ATP-dependent Lon protease